jgi:filamentous hemagglutinin family protein
MKTWCDRLIRLGFTSIFTVTGLVIWELWQREQALAQSRPEADETLGSEGSRVEAFNAAIDLIEGGATRDRNLFHSFREFNIGANRAAYFIHQLGIDNIFSRVTGANPSQIDGILGTRRLENGAFVGSDANLFLINPNGIIFGAGARLDIGGSFAATTADGIQFGEQGFFSATNPESPSQLLSVDPSAFFFNQLTPGAIENQSTLGLRVPDNHSLLFLGGDISLNRGQLYAPGGRIELAGIADTGTIGLGVAGDVLQLNVPDDMARSDVALANSRVDVISDGGGDIVVHARNVNLNMGFTSTGGIFAGIGRGLGAINAKAGDITIDATGAVTLIDNSLIVNAVSGIGNSGDVTISGESINIINGGGIASVSIGQGNAGNVTLEATDTISISGRSPNGTIGGIFSTIASLQGFTGVGEGGMIQLQARRVSLTDGAQVATTNLSTQNNAGNLSINVDTLDLSSGASISANTIGRGNAGNITIDVENDMLLRGPVASYIQSNIEPGGVGDGGDITIEAGSLLITDGSQIQALIRQRSDTAPAGQGNAGTISVEVQNAATFEGVDSSNPNSVSGIITVLDPGTTGRGGDINLQAEMLTLRNGAALNAATFGTGDAGSIQVEADTIRLEGISRGGRSSAIFSTVEPGAVGNGGMIDITADTLTMRNGAELQTIVRRAGIVPGGTVRLPAGQGIAGDIRLNVEGETSLDGANFFPTQIASLLDQGATGRGGNIEIEAGSLSLTNGARLISSTFGTGDAGRIMVSADENVTIDGNERVVRGTNFASLIDSSLGRGATGRGGSIDIEAGSLVLVNGGALNAPTFGNGDAGSIRVEADTILLEGISTGGRSSAIFSTVEPGGVGNGGTIDVIADNLTMRDGAELQTIVRRAELTTEGTVRFPAGQGIAGNIRLDVEGETSLDGANIFPTQIATLLDFGATGGGGNIDIETGSLSLTNGARLNASTSGTGNAGQITIDADNSIRLSGVSANGYFSGIFSTIENGGVGISDGIEIEAGSLRLDRAATIQSLVRPTQAGSVAGQGRAGDITIRVDGNVRIDGTEQIVQGNPFVAQINSSLGAGATGRGGDIFLDAGSLSLLNGGAVAASTFGNGNAGRITIDVDHAVSLSGENIVNQNGNNFLLQSNIATLVAPEAEGNAGRIRIEAGSLNLDDFSFISSGTGGRGDAGDIIVRVDDAIQLEESSNITSGVGAGGRGRGGDIRLRGRSLTLSDGSQVGAFLFREQFGTLGGRGRGGTITINASDFVEIAGVGRRQLPVANFSDPSVTQLLRGFSSGLFTNTERGASGPAGDITVNTRDFRISNGGLVVASTFNEGDGGDIVINADTFTARDGGQIVTNTRSGGTAGSITLNVSDRIAISGVDATFNQRRAQIREILSQPRQSDRVSDILIGLGNRSGLFVNADADATGNAGEISIDTTDLTMSDGAIISAVASGQENAGNIGITADAVELRNNSDIRTSVTGQGDGGNITVDGNYVVALGDSDILAFSQEGSGGNITLPAFFGEGYVETDRDPNGSPSQEELDALDGNDRVDVDASGRVRSGTISTPDTSAIQNSLTELPNTAIDTDNLLANSCVVRNQEQVGTFIITGPGGLPQRPGDNAPSAYPTAPVRSIPDEANDQSWQPGDPIVEPQGVYQLADGRMVLSRECD